MLKNISVIDYDSKVYLEMVILRDVILRKPLGLIFTPEQLAAEKEQIHMAGFSLEHRVIACLLLVPITATIIKMRQVAVRTPLQRQGIGQQLVQFSENWAKQEGFHLMYCHARNHAVPFYLQLGYQIVGEEFVEVGIPHFRMEKAL